MSTYAQVMFFENVNTFWILRDCVACLPRVKPCPLTPHWVPCARSFEKKRALGRFFRPRQSSSCTGRVLPRKGHPQVKTNRCQTSALPNTTCVHLKCLPPVRSRPPCRCYVWRSKRNTLVECTALALRLSTWIELPRGCRSQGTIRPGDHLSTACLYNMEFKAEFIQKTRNGCRRYCDQTTPVCKRP